MIAAEESRLRAEADRRAQREVDRYIAIIRQRVERNWIRPPSAVQGLSCTLQVRVIPSGDVVDVSVVTSSGDGAFDRSAVAAVYKASPLDLPREPGLADRFRVFNLDFRPEG